MHRDHAVSLHRYLTYAHSCQSLTLFSIHFPHHELRLATDSEITTLVQNRNLHIIVIIIIIIITDIDAIDLPTRFTSAPLLAIFRQHLKTFLFFFRSYPPDVFI